MGQSTGLLAAKSYMGESEEDRMIFEGDLVKWPLCEQDASSIVNTVEYKLGGFVYRANDDLPPIPCFLIDETKIEIIGNIHENLEFSESKN